MAAIVEPSAAAGHPAARAGGPGTTDSVRDLLADAAEQTDELISFVLEDGAIVYANAAFCHSLGYEPA
ncbi:MAG: hypothetical protein AB7I13_18080, partial [Vicinamibacterales bacterium]